MYRKSDEPQDWGSIIFGQRRLATWCFTKVDGKRKMVVSPQAFRRKFSRDLGGVECLNLFMFDICLTNVTNVMYTTYRKRRSSILMQIPPVQWVEFTSVLVFSLASKL